MNTDWEKAIEFVLRAEGGYTVDPNDHGGETNFGISKRSYPNVDIQNLTVDQAKEIYQKDFWQACRCDELPSPLAIAVFDTAVNMGAGRARRMLQTALGVIADGIIGDLTISAAHKANAQTVKKYLTIRLSRYAQIMADDKTQLVFSDNWFNRVLSLAQIVLVQGVA